MKKPYMEPELTVQNFQVEEILLASSWTPGSGMFGDNETECIP